MKNLKNKFILMIVFIVAMLMLVPLSVNAANESLVIVKESTNKYIIYLKDYQNSKFEFAFSNNKNETESNLSYINSALDSTEVGANNIAYVDESTISLFENETYMWVKQDGQLKISATQVNIEDNILKEDLSKVGETSKIIPVKPEQKVVEDETTTEGLRKTTTVGIVKINSKEEKIQYQLIVRPEEGANNDLFALAELIEKNDFTDSYTKIKASKEFIELYNQQKSKLKNEDWETVKDLTVLQPEEAKNGEQYILWLKAENTEDAHFLTSYRAEDEKWVQEEIKTVLPYTYDDNIALIALAIVVVAIIIVSVRIALLNKKELK